jgi:uncharacterized protein with ParB-like and HNH nuclease domain
MTKFYLERLCSHETRDIQIKNCNSQPVHFKTTKEKVKIMLQKHFFAGKGEKGRERKIKREGMIKYEKIVYMLYNLYMLRTSPKKLTRHKNVRQLHR